MPDDDQQQESRVTVHRNGGDGPAVMVGVGVGLSSFGALDQLFAGIDPQAGVAYLIAVREEQGLDVGTVMQALSRTAPIPAAPARGGEPILRDRIYVAASDEMIVVVDGHLQTRPASEPMGQRGTFDTLLISLAEHAHERAVAVILAGLGSDGTAGLVATKKFGGLSIAEAVGDDDRSTQGAADPAAIADLYVPADRIAAEIARYARNLQSRIEEEGREESDGIELQVTQVATVLRNVTGHDFHGYKRGTFIRRIQRRMQVSQIDGIGHYVDRLRGDRDEVQQLFQDLLIGVTQFFRDPAEFDTLARELPRLFAGKGADDQLRVWVLGCATGEEAYSIAILLREHVATLDHPPEVQIFATDLDARALNVGRVGRYADSIADHIRPDRLERWFTREGDTYCVSKELREMCIFAPHNIVKDAPFSRIDILSCRNLLIYLSTDLQNRVIPIFHFSLRPDGVLFLGSSENVTRHQKLFAPVDRKSRVFRRVETATRIIPDFPLTGRRHGGAALAHEPPGLPFEVRLPVSVSRQASAVAERYAPAYVIVDAQGDVLHFSGRTGRYLEPSAGAPSLNLPNLVHRDLRLELRSALQRAQAEERRVEFPRLAIHQDDQVFGVNLIVEPLAGHEAVSLVVVFQDLGPMQDVGIGSDRLSTEDHVQRLEAELRVMRDRLQTTIEQLESTNEELKSSNEEYQSINEELQSASEEMETSKEELQSVNEELQTVNGELAHRVFELGRTNSDLKNLLESTQIATIFLDNDLRLRNFTPAATDIFHLLDTDVGRPLDHIVTRVRYPGLTDDVRRVLKTLVPIERQIQDDRGGRRFAARVLPYRSVNNYISGAVVTFTDLTAMHQVQAALQESENNYRLLFESIDEGFCVIDLLFAEGGPVDWRYLRVNPAFERQTGLVDALGRTARDMMPALEQRWFDFYGRVATTGEPGRLEDHAGPLERWFDVYAFRVGDPAERRVAVLFRNVTERKEVEQVLRESEARQAFLLGLSDTLRNLADPAEIAAAVSAMIGHHLGVGRCGYGEVDGAGTTFTTVADWTDDTLPSVAGVRPVADLDGGLVQACRAGRPLAIDDAGAAACPRATLAVPLVKGGDWVATFSAEQAMPRRWTRADEVLIAEVAERSWAAIERARVTAQLRESEARLAAMFETLPVGVAVVSQNGVATLMNAGMRRYTPTDRVPSLDPERRSRWHAEDAEGRPIAAADFPGARALRGEPTSPGLDMRYTDDDGRESWTNVSAVPIRSEGGEIVGQVTVVSDVDAVRRAEAALRDSELRLQTLVEGVPQLVWRSLDGGRWTWASPQWSNYTGLPEAASHGQGWLDAVHPDDRDAARAAWDAATDHGILDLEYRIREGMDRSYRWFRNRATAVHDAQGATIEWLGTSTDVDDMRTLQKRQEVLVAELQHRVRNMLTVVRSVFTQTAEMGGDLESVVDHFTGRLDALARTQVIVTRSAEGTVDLDSLIRDELLSVGVGEGAKVRIGGPDVMLPSKTAEAIGLALHELTTNAIKYGALKVSAATLDIRWDIDVDQGDARRLVLVWQEKGVPAVPTKPTREGFGRELIEEALPYRLGAKTRLEFLGGGVRCSISVPLPRAANGGGGAREGG